MAQSKLNQLARALALVTALALTGSMPAMAATSNSGATTNLTISPFIEMTGIAAAINWSATATFGGETRATSITGINSGAGSSFAVGTNVAGGYTFSVGITDLPGPGSMVVPYNAHSVQLTSITGVTPADLVALSANLTGLGQYKNYNPGVSGTVVPMFTCPSACWQQAAGNESYLFKLQLAVPTGLLAGAYTGTVAYVAETL